MLPVEHAYYIHLINEAYKFLQGNYEHSGDEQERVTNNFRIVSAALNIPVKLSEDQLRGNISTLEIVCEELLRDNQPSEIGRRAMKRFIENYEKLNNE